MYGTAIDKGITWLLIRWQIDRACPKLAAFLQEAANSGHGKERHETTIQVMVQLHSRMQANLKAHGDYNIPMLAKSLETRSPFPKGMVEDMCNYIHAWSGGFERPIYIQDLAEFAKQLQYRREISNQTFRMLAGVPCVTLPEYATAVLKASMVAPGTMVPKLLTSSDIASISEKNLPSVIKAVSMWRAGKTWIKELQPACDKLDGATVAKIRGDMEVRSVMLIHQKRHPKRKWFSTLDAIGQEFLDDVFKIFPDAREMSPPWDVVDADPNAKKLSHGGMMEFDSSGSGALTSQSLTGIRCVEGVEMNAVKGDYDKAHLYRITKVDGEKAFPAFQLLASFG